MKKFNSMIDVEDISVRIPRTDCMGQCCQNNAHCYNTNHHGRHHDTRSYAQVNLIGQAMRPTGHRSKNPQTWRFE
jgi:hypothetical protein